MKTKFKILTILAVILVAMCIFATNKVEATSSSAAVTKGTPTANSLDNLPSVISLDIKESECEKVPELIMNKVISELEKQGMILNKNEGYGENVPEIYVWFGTKDDDSEGGNGLYNGLYKIVIRIKVGYSINKTIILNKEITIKYNNTTNYNENDKNYVANLMKDFDRKSIEIYNRPNQSQDVIEILNKKINDASIKLIYNGMVAGDPEENWGSAEIMVFKNDVYYQTIKVEARSYDVTSDVNVGNNISVSGLLPNVNVKVIPKENDVMVKDVYNVGYNKILGAYELTLTGATSLVNPIDITFNVGTEYNEQMAYILHKKADGTYERFEEQIKDGKVTITVNELSPFVIAVKEKEQAPITNQTEQDKTPTTNKGEKDTTPKTATTDIIGYVLVTTILSGIGIVALKKRI